MSTSGVLPSSSLDNRVTSIFAKMDYPGHHLLQPNLEGQPKSWLIRESRCDGCLSIDYYKNNKFKSSRFALLFKEETNGYSWEPVSLLSYEQIKKLNINFINLSNAADKYLFVITLFDSLERRGFSIDSLLQPNEQQKTRNDEYEFISTMKYIEAKSKQSGEVEALESLEMQLRRVKQRYQAEVEGQECPITCEPIGLKAITPNGHAYNKEALQAWVDKEGTDPMTREPINFKRDILVSNGTAKFVTSLSKAQESIQEQQNRLMTCEEDESFEEKSIETHTSSTKKMPLR